MDQHPRNEEHHKSPLLSVYPASRLFLCQSAKQTYRQMEARQLRWREVDSKKLIEPLSMPDQAQERWREWKLRNADKPTADPAQFKLLPETEVDQKIAALSLSRSERDVVLRRYRIVQMRLESQFQS